MFCNITRADYYTLGQKFCTVRFGVVVSCGLVVHRFGSYAAALLFLFLRQIQWNRGRYSAVVSDWALCAAGRLRLGSWSWTVHSFCPSVH